MVTDSVRDRLSDCEPTVPMLGRKKNCAMVYDKGFRLLLRASDEAAPGFVPVG